MTNHERKTMRTAMATAMLLALAACGRTDKTPSETYDGSTMTPTLIVDFTPEGPSSESEATTMTMVPARGIAVSPSGTMLQNPNGVPTMMASTATHTTRGHRPWADVEIDGMGTMRFTLPYECAYGPIETRIGRRVYVRVDAWKKADGTIRKEIASDEIKASMCEGFAGRDVRRRKSSENPASTENVVATGSDEPAGEDVTTQDVGTDTDDRNQD